MGRRLGQRPVGAGRQEQPRPPGLSGRHPAAGRATQPGRRPGSASACPTPSGTQPLTIKAARVAVSAALNSARIGPTTDRALAFSGRGEDDHPGRADCWSDPVALKVAPLSLAGDQPALRRRAQRSRPGHPGSRPGRLRASWLATTPPTPTCRGPRRPTAGSRSPASTWFPQEGDRRRWRSATITDGYGVQPQHQSALDGRPGRDG
ncbi:hypothetical protein ACRAWD_21825 [Caulobacter segnis]